MTGISFTAGTRTKSGHAIFMTYPEPSVNRQSRRRKRIVKR
ncbi:hypothetical protein AGRO_1004 [Agrobacterium sp. ATCC 31749]|nr:hypothetical protein AGRO_1004 [Agrobacterium sp. ATCC 31749]